MNNPQKKTLLKIRNNKTKLKINLYLHLYYVIGKIQYDLLIQNILKILFTTIL